MTTLRPTHPLTQTLCLLVALGCSSRIDVAHSSTGGSTNDAESTGGAIATGGSSTGIGGSSTGIGGSSTGIGGSSTAAGGPNISTGGVSCCTGLPVCDSGDVQVAPELCNSSGNACYGRSLCCTSITCMVSPMPATGGAGPVWSDTGGAPGGDSGGAPAATGGAANMGYPNAHCTYGQNQTCNDSSLVSAVYGQCEADGYCTCNTGFYPSPSTGKCTSYEQTVCYSPTQNIDKAYVDRAFGCNCDSATAQPFCGIDSSGLRVYLACTTSNVWQSGNTSNCN